MTDQVPPLRPNKSKLRTPSPTNSLNQSVSSLTSPVTTEDQEDYFSTTVTVFPKGKVDIESSGIIQPKPKTLGKLKYKSRFTEHFDTSTRNTIDEAFLEDFTAQQPLDSPLPFWHLQNQRPDVLKATKSFSATPSTAISPDLDSEFQKKRNVLANSTSTTIVSGASLETELYATELNTPNPFFFESTRPRMMPSTSTPLQISNPMASSGSFDNSRPKFSTMPNTPTASTHSQPSFSEQSTSTASLIATNSNRADVIIRRLDNWYSFLKAVIGWAEEVAKINQQSCRGYSQKATPYFGEEKETSSSLSVPSLAIKTIRSKFQSLTTKLAADQQDFSKRLSHHYLPDLQKLRKECKERIQGLKMNPHLYMDELYRRAEITRGKMDSLNRYCKQATKEKGQADIDPWLANLYVLRQLKKEVDEENRLRLLMIPIQQSTKLFEARILESAKLTIEFCYKRLIPETWNDFYDENTNSMKSIVEQITSENEWEQFFESHKKDLVDESYPIKDYIKINYPNKFHPLVLTLIKGKMEKKSSVRKQFVEKYYVLSQGGYLHQFSMDNKVSPEKTIYIPSTTIATHLGVQNLSTSGLYLHYSEEEKTEKPNTFEICKPGASLLQKEKVSVFRTSTKEDLISWCTHLTRISTGCILEGNITQGNYNNTEYNSSLMVENMYSQFSGFSDSRLSTNTATLIDTKAQEMNVCPIRTLENNEIVASDPLPSIQSAGSSMSERSSNEPMGLSNSETQKVSAHLPRVRHSDPKCLSQEQASTKAGTDITANVYEICKDCDNNKPSSGVTINTSKNDKCYENHVADYAQHEEDASSITSISTEIGKAVQVGNCNTIESTTASAVPSQMQNELQSSSKRPQSIASTMSDDAQSSLYFSSTSAPPSPACSMCSSIISIPELHLVEQEGAIVETSSLH